MARKGKSTPTAAPAPPATIPSAPAASKAQPAPSNPKAKKKKASQAPATPKKVKQAKASQSSVQNVPKTPKPVPAASISITPLQTPAHNVMVTLSSTQKGKDIEKLEMPNRTHLETTKLTSNTIVVSDSSSVARTLASISDSTVQSAAPRQAPDGQSNLSRSTSSVTTITSNLDDAIFRLAAATPVPISPVVERQFYESQLLLYVLEKVRGEHKKRQNYHGELDQDETELRRSFIDQLAYICDFKKGGSTVTALALQKTYQGVIFWLAANETVKPKVIDFLRRVFQLLKKVEDGASRKTTETQVLALIVPFNKDRLDYYWSALSRYLPLCVQRLEVLEDGKPTQRELKVLKNFLNGLPQVSKERVNLVKECFEARKLPLFETLAQLTTSGKAHCKFFDDIRHLLGRLGEHVKATKTIVSAALRFPGILDGFEIQARASPPSSCYFQSLHSITLNGMAGRIFSKEDEIAHYQEALETLERTSNGALLGRLQQECCFKTRVHAELLLVDLFYWCQFEFLDDDLYIGCSKPACFNCFQYILAHPGNFVLPACHNKLYLAWRTPDILEENVPLATAIRVREAITNKINSSIRAELRRQIDGRYARKAAQYDSVTGTSSSIRGGVVKSFNNKSEVGEDSISTSAREDLPRRKDSPSQNLMKASTEISKFYNSLCVGHIVKHSHFIIPDDSDDDLSWYQSRVEKIQLL
ncbi:hypothetical protein G7Y89_g7669 [Cudoniella acicularis]|uniref:Uncharacterized protein n=1 Tax=Cudoniella acicularis TaxID=354080 RepID=A0A8H4W1R5_9HELO|nr:hypothetical protein G7Y89_g7669 [Cudoniella acicularis]